MQTRMLMRRRIARYLREPVSVRSATRVIVAAVVTSVPLGGVLIWLAEPERFPNVGVGMWWAIQTVTTVGYGDVTPTTLLGRLVGGAVMVQSIAFISVITAVVTSSFVERARRERQSVAQRAPEPAASPDLPLDERPPDGELPAALASRLDEIASRLDRIERSLGEPGGQTTSPR
jgi:voltage-gated potassium channel